VFGRDAEARATVGEAASCAIPGWFAPVSVGGQDHVDGGAHSPTNADLPAGAGHDLVVISAPMSMDRSAARRVRADRLVRLSHRATLRREADLLRRSGATVVTFQPGPADLAVIGGPRDAMDPARRAPIARQARESTLRRLDRPDVRDALAAAVG
jgi:NTE family protein